MDKPGCLTKGVQRVVIAGITQEQDIGHGLHQCMSLSPPLLPMPFCLEKKVNEILTKFANSTKLAGSRDKEDDIL